MAINPGCNRCGAELNDFGAILLSPPNTDDQVTKLHLCKDCYAIITADFVALPRPDDRTAPDNK